MNGLDRRTFLRHASLAAGSTLLLSGTKASGRAIGANNRLRIAVAGLNGRGRNHISGWLGSENVEIAYLADVDERVRASAVESVNKKVNGAYKCQGILDIRQALDDPTVDAISIAAPNHWHSLMTIWGAQAGKHVYVEKPMSHDVVEGRVAVEAQKRYGVVIQHGTQRRSDAKIAGLHEMIKAGKWGKLKISYGYCCKPRGSIGFEHASPPHPMSTGTFGAGRLSSISFTATTCTTIGTGSGLRVMEISTTKAPTNSMSQDGHWMMIKRTPFAPWPSEAAFSGATKERRLTPCLRWPNTPMVSKSFSMFAM